MNNAPISNVMEKVAIPIWDNRVSPVLDTATRLIILDINDGEELKREVVSVPHENFIVRAKYIAELQVDTVLCGALSKPMRRMLMQRGITIFPWITGETEDVVQAYLHGNLTNERFIFPGRHRRKRRRGFQGNQYYESQSLKNNDFY
jgi:predicted Fe-Mo cluster-binding NifX family protein